MLASPQGARLDASSSFSPAKAMTLQRQQQQHQLHQQYKLLQQQQQHEVDMRTQAAHDAARALLRRANGMTSTTDTLVQSELEQGCRVTKLLSRHGPADTIDTRTPLSTPASTPRSTPHVTPFATPFTTPFASPCTSPSPPASPFFALDPATALEASRLKRQRTG
jgi:hypothetical protein